MRQYIINIIRNSHHWQFCIDSGMEDELPNLDVESDQAVLEYYDYYVMGE